MRFPRESGQALVESILLGLVLLLPLLWALGVLAQLHSAALASTAAVREAAFDAARTSDVAGADRAIRRAVARAFDDNGLEPGRALVRWTSPTGLERGGTVEIRVQYPVSVLQWPFIGSFGGPAIRVEASHIARLDPFRSRE